MTCTDNTKKNKIKLHKLTKGIAALFIEKQIMQIDYNSNCRLLFELRTIYSKKYYPSDLPQNFWHISAGQKFAISEEHI